MGRKNGIYSFASGHFVHQQLRIRFNASNWFRAKLSPNIRPSPKEKSLLVGKALQRVVHTKEAGPPR